jgi:transposase
MPRKRYSLQFKDEACRMVTEGGYTWKQVTAKLGIGKNTLEYWLRQRGRLAAEQSPLTGSDASDEPRVLRARIRELERQLRQAQLEKEILKKATVYFASQKR